MGFGDASGSKRSTAKTYLVDAQANGAEIFVRRRGRAGPGGRARGRGRGGLDRPGGAGGEWAGAAKLTVRAPVVVVAAGSIQSPALLLRSGIGGPAVGDYLRLHPTVAVTAFYDEPQNWMWGPPQAALSHQFADTGDGHGFLIECAQATTGLFAGARSLALGRRSQAAHAPVGARGPVVGVTREHGHGRVEIDAAGNPVVHYPIADEEDRRTLKLAVEQLVRVHEAAGAREIVAGGIKTPTGPGATTSRPTSGAQRARDRAARVRDLLGPSDGQLSHGPRPADLGREPVGRAP